MSNDRRTITSADFIVRLSSALQTIRQSALMPIADYAEVFLVRSVLGPKCVYCSTVCPMRCFIIPVLVLFVNTMVNDK